MDLSVLIVSVGLLAFIIASAVGAFLAWKNSGHTSFGRRAAAGCLMLLLGSIVLGSWIAFDQWDARAHTYREYSTTAIRYRALGTTMVLWAGGVAALVAAAGRRSDSEGPVGSVR